MAGLQWSVTTKVTDWRSWCQICFALAGCQPDPTDSFSSLPNCETPACVEAVALAAESVGSNLLVGVPDGLVVFTSRIESNGADLVSPDFVVALESGGEASNTSQTVAKVSAQRPTAAPPPSVSYRRICGAPDDLEPEWNLSLRRPSPLGRPCVSDCPMADSERPMRSHHG